MMREWALPGTVQSTVRLSSQFNVPGVVDRTLRDAEVWADRHGIAIERSLSVGSPRCAVGSRPKIWVAAPSSSGSTPGSANTANARGAWTSWPDHSGAWR
jgi:hypothetical protein